MDNNNGRNYESANDFQPKSDTHGGQGFDPEYNQSNNQGNNRSYNPSYNQGYPPYYRPKKRRSGVFIWIFIIAAIIVLIMVLSALFGGSKNDVNTTYGGNGDYIAVVKVEGEITAQPQSDYFGNAYGYYHKWIMTQLDYLEEDYYNKGILLYLDSPGGNVYESEELYDRLMRYKENTERPIYVYMGSTAASGAYFIAMAGDKINANINTVTGSVGVYSGPYLDVSELLTKLGVKVDIIKSGKNKAMGNSYEPMTEEQRNIVQGYINECYNRFVDVVVKGRGIERQKALQLCDGRIYTATQAVDNGMIDGIASYDETIEQMKDENDELWDCEISEAGYYHSTRLIDLILGSVKAFEAVADKMGKSELQTALELADASDDLTLKYMMQP